MEPIVDAETLAQLPAAHGMQLLYLSRPECGVCVALAPKIEQLLSEHFPQVRAYYVDLNTLPEAIARFEVFTIPAVLVYADGKLFVREARHISVPQLRAQLQRPYTLLYG